MGNLLLFEFHLQLVISVVLHYSVRYDLLRAYFLGDYTYNFLYFATSARAIIISVSMT